MTPRPTVARRLIALGFLLSLSACAQQNGPPTFPPTTSAYRLADLGGTGHTGRQCLIMGDGTVFVYEGKFVNPHAEVMHAMCCIPSTAPKEPLKAQFAANIKPKITQLECWVFKLTPDQKGRLDKTFSDKRFQKLPTEIGMDEKQWIGGLNRMSQANNDKLHTVTNIHSQRREYQGAREVIQRFMFEHMKKSPSLTVRQFQKKIDEHFDETDKPTPQEKLALAFFTQFDQAVEGLAAGQERLRQLERDRLNNPPNTETPAVEIKTESLLPIPANAKDARAKIAK